MVLQLFINGPPGSGKTTLAKLLCEEFNLELVATGDLLRENMKAQTTAGRRAQRCIAAKKLVPDRVVLDMVEDKVSSCMAHGRIGWVLDSFPRTTDQAELLMAKAHLCPEIVILLDLSEEDCIARISGRRFDPVTGTIYHSPSNLPRDPVIRARLTRRRDDTSDRLSPRFEAYQTFGEATNDLFARRKGVVHRVDASKSSAAVLDDVSALLHSLVVKPRQGVKLDNNSSNSTNNQVQQPDKPNAKALFKQRPDTIPEISEEHEDDDDMQRYQYDWEDNESSIDHSQRESPQKQQQQQQQLPTKQNAPEEKPLAVGAQHSQDKDLLPPLMAALPLPDLPPRAETSHSKTYPPPPAPTLAPTLRPLPAPTGRLKGLRRPSEELNSSAQLNSSIQSVVVRDSVSVRSSSSSSIRSNGSTTLETAAASVDMEKFKELLLDGFEAVKHGRRGRPHPRLIFTDLDFKRVFWQKAMKAADRVGKGKHARLEQSIVLSDVIQVARGMKTAVLKRSGNVARYECFVSLVTPTRTLDLEMPTPQLADFLQRGFDQLLHN